MKKIIRAFYKAAFTTGFITLTLVIINSEKETGIWLQWLQSWLLASLLAMISMLWLEPLSQKGIKYIRSVFLKKQVKN